MELNEVINRISQLRTREGLSARELSLKIGKNEAYINRLEYRKNFEPSITVINDIVDVCNSSLEEFFYYDMSQYKKDKEVVDFLKTLSPYQKEAIMNLYKK